ncbi:MAG TPA: YitT family protein [Pseudogracilibacillus sp.]|nr:YitT family protein [Pseudogracilibacillus sp.]
MRLKEVGVHFYFVGLIVLTLGIAFAVNSSLGTSPFDALLVGLFRTFGLTIGSWEIVVGLSMVLGNALLERKRPEYFALITSLVTGIGIDSWLFVLNLFSTPNTLIGKSIYLALSLVLSGLGIAIYLQSQVAPNPMDRSMLIVAKLTGMSVTYSRALINIALVILALFFGGAIGIGTLINALIAGAIIHYFLPMTTRMRERSLASLEEERELS